MKRNLLQAVVLAFLITSKSAVAEGTGLPFSMQGVYAPGGNCSAYPQVSASETAVMIDPDWGDQLILRRWEHCPDCLGGATASNEEHIIRPDLGPGTPAKAPAFRFEPDGARGVLRIEPAEAPSGLAEIDHVSSVGELKRCDLPSIEAQLEYVRAPTADDAWRRTSGAAEVAASYCPVNNDASGEHLCLHVGCFDGSFIHWRLEGSESPHGFDLSEGSAREANILVDESMAGRLAFTRSERFSGFEASFDMSTHQALLVDLSRGLEAELRLSGNARATSFWMSLSGSARALSDIAATCGDRWVNAHPDNAPKRYITWDSPAMEPAEEVLGSALQTEISDLRASANDPEIKLLAAKTAEYIDGWRVGVAEIGPSTFFGVAGYVTYVLLAPPGQGFDIVKTVPGALVAFDREIFTAGRPRFLLRSVRGLSNEYGAWRWNGSDYVFDRKIRP